MRWFPQPKKLPQKIRRDQSDQFFGGKPELKRASRSCVPNGKEKTHPLLFPSFSIRGGCKRRRRKKFPPVPCISNEPAEGCSFGLCPIKKDLFFYCVCGKGGGGHTFLPPSYYVRKLRIVQKFPMMSLEKGGGGSRRGGQKAISIFLGRWEERGYVYFPHMAPGHSGGWWVDICWKLAIAKRSLCGARG